MRPVFGIETLDPPGLLHAVGFVGLANQVVSTLQQWAQTVFRRKQRFHLIGVVTELEFLRLSMRL